MSSIDAQRAKKFIEASPRDHKISVTTDQFRAMIEARLNRRGLPVDKTFSEMQFSRVDIFKIEEMMRERWNFHLEVYSFDTIKDVVRIITGVFE